MMLHHSPTSPLGWLAYLPPSLPSRHEAWLSRPGALTAGLRQLGELRLRVVREYATGAPADEAHGMGLMPREPVWVREIAMSIDGRDAVVARSLAPLRATHAVWAGMRRLRTRPLADMLYDDNSVRRSPFAWGRLKPPMSLLGTVLEVDAGYAGSDLWARRSVFWRRGQPLLVAECFVPGFWRPGLDPAQTA
jgi:chorismate--pyruvate lyase